MLYRNTGFSVLGLVFTKSVSGSIFCLLIDYFEQKQAKKINKERRIVLPTLVVETEL